jgi:hypothetical protein
VIAFVAYRCRNPNNICIDFHWPEYDVTDRCYAIIRDVPSTGTSYRRQRMDFWQNLINKHVLDHLNSVGESHL